MRPPLNALPGSPRRLPASARRTEILAAAARVIDAQGFLPVPFEQVARAAGVSKALVYAYFPNQAALGNALLAQALGELADAMAKVRARRLAQLARAAAGLYLDQALRHGALLHVLLTDPELDGQRDRAVLARRDAIWRRLLRAARAELPSLTPRQAVAALQVALAIPEELGRQAQRGEIKPERARLLCDTLIAGAVRGLAAGT